MSALAIFGLLAAVGVVGYAGYDAYQTYSANHPSGPLGGLFKQTPEQARTSRQLATTEANSAETYWHDLTSWL